MLKGDRTAQCITRICMVKSASRPSYCTGSLLTLTLTVSDSVSVTVTCADSFCFVSFA